MSCRQCGAEASVLWLDYALCGACALRYVKNLPARLFAAMEKAR